MTRRVLSLVVVLAATAGLSACGAAESKPEPGATRPPATSAPTTTTPTDLSTLTILPGEIGAARVGMTRAEWTKTGLFEKGAALCDGELIHWAMDDEAKRLQVLTDPQGTITQLSVGVPGPHTEHGDIEVGDTYGDLKAAWGRTLTKPAEDGFDQASVYPPGEEDGDVYIAFLLDAPAGKVTDATKIARIAVSGGQKPDFQYDC